MTDSSCADIRKSDEDYADKLRALIRHENDVSNHRTTWLMVIQGILLTAVSAVLKDTQWAAAALAVIGILVAISIGHSLRNSYESRKYFKELWKKRIANRGYKMGEEVLPLDGGYPDNTAIHWLLPDKFIPKLIITTWVLLLAYLFIQRLHQCTP